MDKKTSALIKHQQQLLSLVYQTTQSGSLASLLPLLFNIKGEAYSINDYFPFEPLFRTHLPQKLLIIAGRQISKSTSLSAFGITQCLRIPNYSTLYVLPLFEMTKRLSTNYVRAFIDRSPFRNHMIDERCIDTVLQKSFRNNSQLHFTYAYTSAERTRGIASDLNCYDEVQSLDFDLVQIINETMSGSRHTGISFFAGTPLTMENTIQQLKEDSSEAEFIIQCQTGGCRHFNIPNLSNDLEAMTGPYNRDISEKSPGLVCAKCQKPLNPRTGRWIHANRALRWEFAGYHMPQHIFPLHYTNPMKWKELLDKRDGRNGVRRSTYDNEVCGESSDSGSKIITKTDLLAARLLPWNNTIEDAKKVIGGYKYVVLGVDWGGGGEKQISFTKMAVTGLRPDGSIDVIYGYASRTPHDHMKEAHDIMRIMNELNCILVAHDYGGAGAVRETVMVQSGVPLKCLIPCSYNRGNTGKLMYFNEPTEARPRGYYQIDKTWSLQLVCNQIKLGNIKFFQFDERMNSSDCLPADFLALVEEKSDNRHGGDNYAIIRDPKKSDDFAHAVNLGACTLWNMSQSWPDTTPPNSPIMPPEFGANFKAALPRRGFPY